MSSSELNYVTKSRLRVLLFSAFAALTAFARGAEPGIAGTLPEDYLPTLRPILVQALKQSPNTLLANIGIASAEASQLQTDSIRWPSLAGVVSYGSTGSSSADAATSSSVTSTGLNYSLGLSMPLYQFGALKARSDISALGVKIAQKQYAEAYRVLVSTLRLQYLALVGKNVQLRSLRFRLKVVENELAAQVAKVKSGEKSPGDINGTRLDTEEARLGLDRAEQDFQFSKRTFTRLAGLSDLADSAIPDELPSPTLDQALAKRLFDRFSHGGAELTAQGQIYDMSIKQGELGYKIAATGLLPKFSLNSGYSLAFSTSATAGIVSQTAIRSHNIGVQATWTVFDGFATRGGKLSSLAAKRSAERSLQTYVDTITDAADNQRKQLEFAGRAMGIADLRNSLARSAVQITIDQSRTGVTGAVAIDAATVTYNVTSLIAIQTRADYLAKWADYLSTLGLDPVLENLPAQYLTNSNGK